MQTMQTLASNLWKDCHMFSFFTLTVLEPWKMRENWPTGSALAANILVSQLFIRLFQTSMVWELSVYYLMQNVCFSSFFLSFLHKLLHRLAW